jgi:hypothetical protein
MIGGIGVRATTATAESRTAKCAAHCNPTARAIAGVCASSSGINSFGFTYRTAAAA